MSFELSGSVVRMDGKLETTACPQRWGSLEYMQCTAEAHQVTEAYEAEMDRLSLEQVTKAGVRLGRMLNDMQLGF